VCVYYKNNRWRRLRIRSVSNSEVFPRRKRSFPRSLPEDRVKMSTDPKPAEKKPKAPRKPRPPAAHPPYNEMVVTAITTLKERNGSSRQKIIKFIQTKYKVGEGFETHVKMALRRGVKNGSLSQTKGTGASGSFKITKKAAEAKPAAKKPAAKKPAAKKATQAKKPAAKTPAGEKAKKPAAKKPAAQKAAKPKKPADKKKPAAAKASKPKAKKPPTKAGTPKKTAKPPAKKQTKKVAKSPKKKAAAPKK